MTNKEDLLNQRIIFLTNEVRKINRQAEYYRLKYYNSMTYYMRLIAQYQNELKRNNQ